MPINISESEILEAVQSAQSGAFFRDSLTPVSDIEVQNSITWLEHKEDTYRSKSREAAEAKPLEKARLVRRRKSQTGEFAPKTTQKQSLQHTKSAQLQSQYRAIGQKLTPEKLSEWFGVNEGECFDLETGEVRPIHSVEIERHHFESAVLSAPKTEPRPTNKKPKLVTPNYKKTLTHFQARNWNDEYRVVCTQMTSSSDAPDANTGDRVTESLTSRARGKIIESGTYMQAVKGGFNAFVTVTLDEKARYRIDNDHYRKVAKRKAGTVLDAVYSEVGELLHEEIIASGAYTAVVFERSTIGQELSRFLDSLGKMHKRGMKFSGTISNTNKSKSYEWGRVDSVGRDDRMYPWGKVSSVGGRGESNYQIIHNNQRLYDWGVVECIETTELRAYTNSKQEIQKIECIQDPKKKPVFDYLWVAEAPQKKLETKQYSWGEIECVGHQNYHAHLLFRWNVEEHFFHEWAARIERLWGQGFVNIQRIQSPAAAASYLLKALGYMTKGGDGSQGVIRGNRYNISKYARAEGWENCATHESQHMYGLIQEYLKGLEEKRKRKNLADTQAKRLTAETAKLTNINKQSPSEKREKYLEKLKTKLEAVTTKVKSLSEELHGNFARGGVAKFANEGEFARFLDFAIGVRGWRLKTVFSRECSREYIQQQRAEENAVTKMLVNAQRVVDESIESVISWYSRFERVSPNDDEYHNMSLVTGDLCAN